MSRRDLGSLFDEEAQGTTPGPTEAPRPAPVDESLINAEARQMLEERSRAAREATARAAEVAAKKGMQFGKAALGALGRMKEERQRRAQAKAEARESANEVALLDQEEPTCASGGVQIEDGMGQMSPKEPALVVEIVERPAARSAPAHIEVPAAKRPRRYIWIVGGVLALTAVGGVAYWRSNKPVSEHSEPPKVEVAPIVKPVEPVPAPALKAPVVAPAPIEAFVPAPAPVEEIPPPPVIEQQPEPIAPPPPKADPAQGVPSPKPVPKPRQKKADPAPPPAAPANEEQQIEQIRDFGKQLEQLGKR